MTRKKFLIITAITVTLVSFASYMVGVEKGEYNIREEQISDVLSEESSAESNVVKLDVEKDVSYTIANSRLSEKELHEMKERKHYKVSQDVAAQIALVVAKSLYGDNIYNEIPFQISLFRDSLWIIEGTQKSWQQGGTVRIVIERNGGEILSIVHGK